MSLFKKILSYFREEIEIIEVDETKPVDADTVEEPKPEPVEEQPPRRAPAPASFEQKRAIPSLPSVQQLSTRVAYRYPTVKRSGHEENPRRSPRITRHEPASAAPAESSRSEQGHKPVYTSASGASRVAPRPFKPTEIPSPIYGFRSRPVKEDIRSVRSEEREKRNEPLLLFSKEQAKRPLERQKEAPIQEVPRREVPKPREEEEAPAQKPAVLYPEKSMSSEQKEKPRERRHSPFNVVMLKKDREKIAKPKPALKQQPHSASAPSNVPDAKAKEDKPPVQEPAVIPEKINRPPLSFLTPPAQESADDNWVQEKSALLNETLKSFNINAHVTGVTTGPSITRFEVTPAIGVKVSKIVSLTDDIKRSLAARTIRIEAPIPGTQVVGIELPNEKSRPVYISEIIGHSRFQSHSSPLASALGLDIAGNPVVLDLQKMPHGLIAGATGSGKSVCINSILVSLLYKAAPHELKLLLIDPKMVELTPYNGIPHLASPVITDVKAATAALKWAVEEMERRYQLFVHAGVRDMASYNAKVKASEFNEPHLPYLVIVIDELADLMMMAPGDVEESICRIAQKARACGIHLIVATQRPSVDVITGLIKANIPTRIAFSVSSQIDSRTILDKVGAEKLLGKGDMLFLNNGASESVRLQGTFVTNEEIDEVVQFAKAQQQPDYLFKQEELLQKAAVHEEEDELFQEACELVVRQGGASTSMLQRNLKVGYNRAARLIEIMEEKGLVSGQRAGRPREVLISEEELMTYFEESN
ncbi:DNA translocase FtsK [Domibacillus sp. PGB-M46]|uniref:DNA translocase FtsK n=1 Tax=Domibacillus sp. PGB-M46 TaxID=2910255 RepID=UPI001F5AEABB|nr:DNA translocase FtsK [Domibacillus sp. PGB-M46]MCI2254290.1 DNA translocase FtsK [Domibacillus sp. PGB-M46]